MDIINICQELDKQGLYELADHMIYKFASKSLMDKKILIPNDVKEAASKAYDKRNGEIKFGDAKQISMARELKTRVYMDLRDVLEVFKYTVKHKTSHSKSKKNRTYWEYECYGGDAGKDWSDRIIRLYLPDEWKIR